MKFFPLKIWRTLFSAKRPFKLTRAGWVFILYTIGVGAGAINTGNNLLYLVFGVFLGLLVASGLLSDLSLWGLSVSWEFPYATHAGSPTHIMVNVQNEKKRLPSLSVHVQLEGLLAGKPHTVSVYIPFLSAHQMGRFRMTYLPRERGWFQMTSLKVVTRYPFGLLQKWWTIQRIERGSDPNRKFQSTEGFFVFPELLPVAEPARLDHTPGLEESDPAELKGQGSTIFSVRDYHVGDNPRHIHWRATAKRGAINSLAGPKWLVREMEEDQKESVFLTLPSLDATKGLADSEFELFIKYTASLLRLFTESGVRSRLGFECGEGTMALVRTGHEGSEKEFEFLGLWLKTQSQREIDGFLELPFPIGGLKGVGCLNVREAFLSWQKK